MYLTFFLALLPFFSLDNDYQAGVHIINGFSYGIVLWLSAVEKPSRSSAVLGVIILGVCNLLIYFSLFPFILVLPDRLVNLLFLPWMSLVGATITILVLQRLWGIRFSLHSAFLLLGLILIASICTMTFKFFVIDKYFENSFFISINSPFWMFAFSISLLIIDKRKNQDYLSGSS